jgi:ABC-type Fe3+/spermidine/putrescine transport system ATPase subunit
MLRIIGGFEYLTEGTLLFEGKDIAERPALQAPGQHQYSKVRAGSRT